MLREDLATAVRELSGDLMRAARGEGTEFAQRYADRYDLALAERASDDFRAAEESRASRGARSARHDFDYEDDYGANGSVAPLDFAEAPLTDEA